MITFIGGFLTVIGLFLIGVAQLLGGPGASASDQAAAPLLTIIGGGVAVLGLIIFVVGLVTGRKARAIGKRILESGVAAEAMVTFVDRNYNILVNERPIYSIVEFKFQDMSGAEHVFQHTTVNAELVIRNQVEVGSTVNIKYLPEDPSQNILMLENPSATT
jgi:hypothetical protein